MQKYYLKLKYQDNTFLKKSDYKLIKPTIKTEDAFCGNYFQCIEKLNRMQKYNSDIFKIEKI